MWLYSKHPSDDWVARQEDDTDSDTCENILTNMLGFQIHKVRRVTSGIKSLQLLEQWEMWCYCRIVM